MSGMNVNSSNNTNSVDRNESNVNVKRGSMYDEYNLSIFDKLDSDQDGVLSSSEINNIQTAYKEAAAADGDASSLSKAEAKILMTRLGLSGTSVKKLLNFLSNLKDVIAKTPEKPVEHKEGDIETGVDEKGEYTKKYYENGEYEISRNGGKDRIHYNKNGRILEQVTNGKIDFVLRDIEPDGRARYVGPERTLGFVNSDGSIYTWPKVGETLEDVIKRYGITDPNDIALLKKYNPHNELFPKNNKDDVIYYNILIPAELLDKLDMNNVFINPEEVEALDNYY